MLMIVTTLRTKNKINNTRHQMKSVFYFFRKKKKITLTSQHHCLQNSDKEKAKK